VSLSLNQPTRVRIIMTKQITVNGIPFQTIESLYDYLWTCPELDMDFTWYKIDLAISQLKQGE